MKVSEIVTLLDCEVISGFDKLDIDVTLGGSSDLMSDILALSKPGMLVLTGQATIQAIRTALVTDLSGLIIVRDKSIPVKAIEMAKANNFLLLKTKLGMFTASGRLYHAGLSGGDE